MITQPQAALVSGQHLDFIVVGAGISGLGATYNTHKRFPDHSFAVLEAMDGFGGTWWTHRYPGARSDSDCYTYGYSFKPWETGRAIGTADEIRAYLGELIEENQLTRHIYYGHRITAARWSSQDKCWTLEVTRIHSGETLTLTTSFLWMCSGYYDHTKGYTPEWSGMGEFKGQWVHPQHWPQDLDCTGKQVVVIGSGATAATLIPSLADTVAHVTMLQRSPTFSRQIPLSIRWRHNCANWMCVPTGCTRSCGAHSLPRWTAKSACPSSIPRKCARGFLSRREPSCLKASTWTSISTRAIAHGSNASRWFLTVTCLRPSAAARLR
ncbi:flavin-containing monooxygenase [Delftia tsuruhatensis]